ncbi:MAG: response regulator, partial [Pedobacter sp.]
MKKKILVLENDKDTLDIIEMILEPEGFDIIKTSVQLLDTDLPAIKPDLVVLDHLLNYMYTGGELCQMIKANEATKDVAVVLISAVNDLPEIAEKFS